MDVRAHQDAALRFLEGLSPLLWPWLKSAADRPGPVHVSGAFDASWIEGLPLPLADGKSARQSVALVDGTDFHRELEAAAVVRAHRQLPRTRVYESLDTQSDGWPSLVSLDLARLIRRTVVCTAYESQTGDRNLGAHRDRWLGAAVQMRGAKSWSGWPPAPGVPDTIVTRPGDVLIMPQGVRHAVTTPQDPGHSVHLLFAVTDDAIGTPKRAAA